ncbi:hypothetical protein GJ496_010050 [Pomphorhynchus laevis]|nr:hypothetical protein GJ496_010050 [Pomphorhynchus laevis]
MSLYMISISRPLSSAVRRIPSILNSPLIEPEVPKAVKYVGEHKKRSRLIYGWGYTGTGALGFGHANRITAAVPTRIRSLSIKNSKICACGVGFSIFVNNRSQIYLLGLNNHFTDSGDIKSYSKPELVLLPITSQWGVKPITVDLSAGKSHFVVTCLDKHTNTSKLFVFGDQSPREIVNAEAFGNLDIPKITCGADTTFMLYPKTGQVFSFGRNDDCQLGHTLATCTPHLVKGDIQSRYIVKVVSKLNFALALDNEGYVYHWGSNEFNTICETTNSQNHLPQRLNAISDVQDIAVTENACLALTKKENRLLAWGAGNAEIKELKCTNDMSEIKSLFSGFKCFALIDSNFKCFMWGNDYRGILAPTASFIKVKSRTKHNEVMQPRRISLPVDKVESVNIGLDHVIAICKTLY